MLLVTTSHSLILLNPENWQAWRLTANQGLYYGLAQDHQYIYVAARGRLVSSDVPPESERGKIIIYDKSLRKVNELAATFPLRDIHEIAIIDRKLWVTCSFDNKIAILDGDVWSEWFPLGEPLSEPYDKNHFNSIAEFGNEVCVVAHNKGASELYFFDKFTRKQKKVIPLGKAAHNVWLENGSFYTCSSAEGMIRSSSGESINVGGFPRGIVTDDKYNYLGISEVAERKDRDFTDGCVKVFNKSWEEQLNIILQGEGLILDLMQVDFPVAKCRFTNWLKTLKWKKLKPLITVIQEQ